MCRLALAGGRFLSHAQKSCLDEGWEVTLIPALKQKIKKKAGKFPFRRSFASVATVEEQLAVCTWDGFWAVHH